MNQKFASKVLSQTFGPELGPKVWLLRSESDRQIGLELLGPFGRSDSDPSCYQTLVQKFWYAVREV